MFQFWGVKVGVNGLIFSIDPFWKPINRHLQTLALCGITSKLACILFFQALPAYFCGSFEGFGGW